MSEASLLRELNMLCRLVLDPLKGYLSIRGWLKDELVTELYSDGQRVWLVRTIDERLYVYNDIDNEDFLVCELDSYGVSKEEIPRDKFNDACGLVLALRKHFILDALAYV